MYARHYSHRLNGAEGPATAGSDRTTGTGCPPVLRLVPPLEETPPAPSAGSRADRPATARPVRRKDWFPASEAGMATAEYAIATLTAVGFAGLLVFILRSEEVRGVLLTLIRTALALP